jgi:hypothetical protein
MKLAIFTEDSIDASYQVSVQLAKQFQGRRFLEIDQSETIGHSYYWLVDF